MRGSKEERSRQASKTTTTLRQDPALPAVLFDLDGTLIDSVYEHVETWSAALRRHKIVLPTWKIHRRIGMSGKSFARELLRELKNVPRGIHIENLESEHDAAFARKMPALQLLPGSQDLLDHLTRCRVQWAVATTGKRKQAGRLLKRLKIPNQTVIVTGDDAERAKPSPDIFLAAAAKLGVEIQNCIVIGDSPWDMLAAGRKNALGVGLLSGGYSQEELERAGAFRIYDDPADLLMHIEQLGLPGPD